MAESSQRSMKRGGAIVRSNGRLGLGLIIALTVSVVCASPAVAKPSKLDLTWDAEVNQLAVGEAFEMVLTVPFNESNNVSKGALTLETGDGVITCSASEFNNGKTGTLSGIDGVDETNHEAVDKIEMTASAGSLNNEESCPSTSALGSPAEVGVEPNGAILSLAGLKGTAQLKAKSASSPIRVQILYPRDKCDYKTTKLKGTLKLEPWFGFNQIALTFEGQKLKVDKANSTPGCPKQAVLSAPFGYQNRGTGFGEGFGHGYYIYGHLA